jgi:hypothetical protein
MPVQLVTLRLLSMLSLLAPAAVVHLYWSDTLGQVRVGVAWRTTRPAGSADERITLAMTLSCEVRFRWWLWRSGLDIS